MSSDRSPIVVPSPLSQLRRFTPARIALGRAGTSLPTKPHLDFQLAHARARNAVHHELDVPTLETALRQRNFEPIVVHSAAENRPVYLQRPDKGRRLDAASRELIADRAKDGAGYDVAFVIGDGLSALAIEENVPAFLDAVTPSLKAAKWRIAPLVVVRQARVAVGDEVAELLGANMVVMLIGERPGLSSPDSLGVYLTLHPRVGLTDEARNCISNVRREGMTYEQAAHKLVYLMTEARKRGMSGVMLKDESETLAPAAVAGPARGTFLTSDD